jgi:hypothetical protein
MFSAITQGQACAVRVGQHYSAQVGLEVYRNNYRGALQDALQAAYPVLEKLVGADYFRQLARDYIAQHTPTLANLFAYGAHFADWLQARSPLIYLPDVARLEWACHLAYYAPDAPHLTAQALADIRPEQYPHLRFLPHPACQIISSPYPIADIWLAHQQEQDFSLDLTQGAQNALVWRQAGMVQVSALQEDCALWLQLLIQQQSLNDATSDTLHQYPEFNLATTLHQLMQQGVWQRYVIQEATCTP